MLSPTELEAGRTDSRFLAWRKQMNQIFYAFLYGTVVYAGLTIAGIPPKEIFPTKPIIHYGILLGICAAMFLLTPFVSGALRKKSEPTILNESFQKATATVTGYILIQLAIAEAVAIYGFISPFLIGRRDFVLPLIAVGAVAVVVSYRLAMPWAETMLLTRIARERLSGQ